MPANAGIQQRLARTLDSRLRGNDKTALCLVGACFACFLSVRSGGLLLRWSGCGGRLSRLTGAVSVPSRMAAVASLTAMAAPSFPSLRPRCPRGFSGAGGGRSGVQNGRSGFLRLGHYRLKHARKREAQCRPQAKQGKHFSARNVFHIDLPVSRLFQPRTLIKTNSPEPRLNIR
jgi:hypothetical protein